MNSLKGLFSLPVLLNVLVGLALVIGLVLGLQAFLQKYTKHDQTIEIPDISKMNLFDALPVLQQAGLKYEIDSFKFDDKFPSYSIFDVYPAIGTNVKEGRRIFIRANPKTWPPVQVPALKDQYKNSAFRTLENARLQVGDTIYQPHKYKDIVLDMMYEGRPIKPGELVPYMSKIDLIIGSSLQKNVPMIDVTGMSLDDAKHMLEQNYFEVGRVDERDVLNKESDNIRVFYQSPSAGDIFDQGESVILFLTDQPEDELNERVAELNEIYQRTIKTDSTGSVNYEFSQKMSRDVSSEVRRQINTNIDNSTSRGETPRPTPQQQNNSNTAPPPDDGVIIE